MKNIVILFLLPLLLFGCSKKQTEAERRASIQPLPALPFQITVVDTPEVKEINDTSNYVATLLASKDYDKLDKLAAEYRTSKECYANGTWKLMSVYAGFELPDNADGAAWLSRQNAIQNWIQAKPESVTARIALAKFLTEYAWNARGSGYENTVTDEGWRLFAERLNESAKILNEAKELKETCPVYWSTLMRVGLGLQISKEQFNNIFHQAIAATPDFSYYYQRRAIFLLPRWYGDEGEWEKDLAESADQVGGEQGDLLYARVVWNMHLYGEYDVFNGNKISWDRVDRGFATILKQFSDSLAAKNERAHLAAIAGDKENAKKYFIATDGKVDLSQWAAKGEFVDAANWAFGP
jgi:hypothetical protein